MAGTYNYLTWGQLKAALLQRLQDTAGVNTTNAEAGYYLSEALRVLNAQTLLWPTDYQFDFFPGDTWKSLNVAGSPRQRTITDSYLFTQMQYMLMEPPTGSVWTGTIQYNITLFSQALQYRRDQLLLLSAANTVNLLQNSPLSTVRTLLPDSTLDIKRVRWIPDSTLANAPAPYALGREDVLTRNAWGDLLPIQTGEPQSWMITANQPLQFDCSCPPNQPGDWDMLVAFSGIALAPPTSNVLGLPDDWTWVALYGALADVLATSPEGRDMTRAKYCLQRFEAGAKAMIEMPWLDTATVAKLPVKPVSYQEMDSWAQNWENTWPAGDPQIVVGGVDFIALAPFVPIGSPSVSSVLTLIGNAPIPANDSTQVQLDRAGVDAILAYAQHLASFKFGGQDFALTIPLFQQFESYCRAKNAQYAALGISRPEMIAQGNSADVVDPRFEKGGLNAK